MTIPPFGFIMLLGASLCIWLFSKFRRVSAQNQLLKKLLHTTLFIGLSQATFFLAKGIGYAWHSHDMSFLNDQNLQSVLVMVAVSMLLGSMFLLLINDAYYRILVFSFINLITCGFAILNIGAGIINVVWAVILTGVAANYLLIGVLFHTIDLMLDEARSIVDLQARKDILQLTRQDADKYLKLGVQGFLALGASVGVSMSILFKDGHDSWENLENQITAGKMVVGVCLVGIGLLSWVVKPYLDSSSKMLVLQKSIYRNSNALSSRRKGSRAK